MNTELDLAYYKRSVYRLIKPLNLKNDSGTKKYATGSFCFKPEFYTAPLVKTKKTEEDFDEDDVEYIEVESSNKIKIIGLKSIEMYDSKPYVFTEDEGKKLIHYIKLTGFFVDLDSKMIVRKTLDRQSTKVNEMDITHIFFIPLKRLKTRRMTRAERKQQQMQIKQGLRPGNVEIKLAYKLGSAKYAKYQDWDDFKKTVKPEEKKTEEDSLDKENESEKSEHDEENDESDEHDEENEENEFSDMEDGSDEENLEGEDNEGDGSEEVDATIEVEVETEQDITQMKILGEDDNDTPHYAYIEYKDISKQKFTDPIIVNALGTFELENKEIITMPEYKKIAFPTQDQDGHPGYAVFVLTQQNQLIDPHSNKLLMEEYIPGYDEFEFNIKNRFEVEKETVVIKSGGMDIELEIEERPRTKIEIYEEPEKTSYISRRKRQVNQRFKTTQFSPELKFIKMPKREYVPEEFYNKRIDSLPKLRLFLKEKMKSILINLYSDGGLLKGTDKAKFSIDAIKKMGNLQSQEEKYFDFDDYYRPILFKYISETRSIEIESKINSINLLEENKLDFLNLKKLFGFNVVKPYFDKKNLNVNDLNMNLLFEAVENYMESINIQTKKTEEIDILYGLSLLLYNAILQQNLLIKEISKYQPFKLVEERKAKKEKEKTEEFIKVQKEAALLKKEEMKKKKIDKEELNPFKEWLDDEKDEKPKKEEYIKFLEVKPDTRNKINSLFEYLDNKHDKNTLGVLEIEDEKLTKFLGNQIYEKDIYSELYDILTKRKVSKSFIKKLNKIYNIYVLKFGLLPSEKEFNIPTEIKFSKKKRPEKQTESEDEQSNDEDEESEEKSDDQMEIESEDEQNEDESSEESEEGEVKEYLDPKFLENLLEDIKERGPREKTSQYFTPNLDDLSYNIKEFKILKNKDDGAMLIQTVDKKGNPIEHNITVEIDETQAKVKSFVIVKSKKGYRKYYIIPVFEKSNDDPNILVLNPTTFQLSDTPTPTKITTKFYMNELLVIKSRNEYQHKAVNISAKKIFIYTPKSSLRYFIDSQITKFIEKNRQDMYNKLYDIYRRKVIKELSEDPKIKNEFDSKNLEKIQKEYKKLNHAHKKEVKSKKRQREEEEAVENLEDAVKEMEIKTKGVDLDQLQREIDIYEAYIFTINKNDIVQKYMADFITPIIFLENIQEQKDEKSSIKINVGTPFSNYAVYFNSQFKNRIVTLIDLSKPSVNYSNYFMEFVIALEESKKTGIGMSFNTRIKLFTELNEQIKQKIVNLYLIEYYTTYDSSITIKANLKSYDTVLVNMLPSLVIKEGFIYDKLGRSISKKMNPIQLKCERDTKTGSEANEQGKYTVFYDQNTGKFECMSYLRLSERFDSGNFDHPYKNEKFDDDFIDKVREFYPSTIKKTKK